MKTFYKIKHKRYSSGTSVPHLLTEQPRNHTPSPTPGRLCSVDFTFVSVVFHFLSILVTLDTYEFDDIYI